MNKTPHPMGISFSISYQVRFSCAPRMGSALCKNEIHRQDEGERSSDKRRDDVGKTLGQREDQAAPEQEEDSDPEDTNFGWYFYGHSFGVVWN
jgi:hypothetical protein